MVQDVINALRRVTHPLFFESERGFQGAMNASLVAVLGDSLPAGAIIEEEHQKRIGLHGIRRRPDIIIHVPTPPGGDRQADNLAVFALKHRATPARALQDFEALDAMFGRLHYPFGAFVNIGSTRTHADQYRGAFPERIYFLLCGTKTEKPMSDTRGFEVIESLKCRERGMSVSYATIEPSG